MNIDINSLGYGNPSRKHLDKASKPRPLVPVEELPAIQPPANDSERARQEILELIRLQDTFRGHPFMSFVDDADEDMEELYEQFLGSNGIEFDYYERLFEDLASVTIEIKLRYNRMRPFQLAGILGVELYPYESESAHSPSYPSGHTLQAYVVSMMIAEQHPELANEAMKLAASIAVSRKIAGYHYESDNEYSRVLANELMPHIVRP